MRALLLALLLTVVAFAGCTDPDDNDGTETSGTSTSTKSATRTGFSTRSGTGTTSVTGTGTGAPLPGNASLSADVANGTAPLAVNFTINATAGATSWHMAFGDGDNANGTTVPATVAHTYDIGGNFTANVTVVFPGGNVTRSLNVTVAVDGGSGPDVLVFEFADSLGCAGDAGADTCISFNAGPDFPISGIDGYWQALDERYWGLSFTSVVDQVQPAVADSDCAFTDAAHAIIGEANNSSSPCAGTVPDGTAFLFIYPYALPALSMTVTFTV